MNLYEPPLFGRISPKLDLAYREEDLKLSRYHKNLTLLDMAFLQ
tara:strand:+ start:481 stop:612 length:132 start_codon:yes stop_codon:yes gene_type:complete